MKVYCVSRMSGILTKVSEELRSASWPRLAEHGLAAGAVIVAARYLKRNGNTPFVCTGVTQESSLCILCGVWLMH